MDLLRKIYYDPKNPGSFGGRERLLREASKHLNVTRKNIENFLINQNTYTLHKDRRVRFKRNKVIAFFKDEQWQADLAEMQRFARLNGNHRYILVVIDVFTKYLFARPLKDK